MSSRTAVLLMAYGTPRTREEIEPCFETLLACGFKERRG